MGSQNYGMNRGIMVRLAALGVRFPKLTCPKKTRVDPLIDGPGPLRAYHLSFGGRWRRSTNPRGRHHWRGARVRWRGDRPATIS